MVSVPGVTGGAAAATLFRSMSKEAQQRMEKIVSLCKRRGFIFQSSEIYGGLNGFWDYGPMGVELKRNLKDFWWRRVVHEREDMVGMDGAIIMNRAVWKGRASFRARPGGSRSTARTFT